MAAEQQQFPSFSPPTPIDNNTVGLALADTASPLSQKSSRPGDSQSSMFSLQNSPTDHIDFTHPFTTSSSFSDNNQSTDAQVDTSAFSISLNSTGAFV